MSIRMQLDDRIRIRAVSSEALPLAGIKVRLIVHAGYKNPYVVEFPPTNDDGTTSLPKQQFIEQFESHWSMGLMDHNGSLESASQYVTVEVENPDLQVRTTRRIAELPVDGELLVPIQRRIGQKVE